MSIIAVYAISHLRHYGFTTLTTITMVIYYYAELLLPNNLSLRITITTVSTVIAKIAFRTQAILFLPPL